MPGRRISIITPSLNRREMLEGVIQNVSAQGYPEYEHIVIDGGSTDGTQDMVRNYPHVRFFCGPDEGMYDALNKGLEIATGEIVGFLNTDDFYAENIFSKIAARFDDRSVMAVAGHAIVFHESDNGLKEIVRKYSPAEESLLECSTIGKNYFNAWFFRKSVFEKIGNFNAEYQVAGDREFMLRLCLHNIRYATLDELVYQYRRHAGSLTFDNTGKKRELSAKDHLAMTASYLRNESLPPEARKLLVQLRTREDLEMAFRSLKTRKFHEYIYYMIDSARYDFTWVFKSPWHALREGSTRLIKLVRRGSRWIAGWFRYVFQRLIH